MSTINCSNCHITLSIPPGAKSIRCSECEAITQLGFASFGLTPSTSFNYVAPQSGFSQDTYAASFGLTPSKSFNYVPPQSGFGSMQQQQQQQPVFPSLTTSNSFSYGAPGRKKAVIIGVSYKNTRHELKGCINDAKFMKHLLITKFWFTEDQIVMLTEEEIERSRIPTGRNMRQAMAWLIEGCQQGDSLVFHFSGHGSRQRNYNGDEIDGYDETLCPLDFETEGMIVDDEINAKLVKPLPYGVKLHAIIDACHSGTVLDLPNLCRMKSNGEYRWEDHSPKSGIWKGSSGGEVISISGCDDDQTSADTSALSKITSTGAMTFIFIEAIEHGNASTYGNLLSSMRNAITNAARRGTRGLTQEPQLTAWEQFDMYAKPFSM